MRRTRTRRFFGPLESRVMAIAWKARRPLTVREVVDALGAPKPAYTTVMTVMSRLAEKSLLRREPAGKAYTYAARYSEHEFLERAARRSVRKLVEDFGEVALAQFAAELDRSNAGAFERLRRLRERPD
jgi:predicted transcriptional regulator